VKNDGLLAVTGSLQVKYHRPCLTGQPVLLRGKVEKVSGRVIEVSGEVIQDGSVVASGKGIFVIPRQGVIRK
jgi:acyl-coenzyme A thioesterase PaaI-like protein